VNFGSLNRFLDYLKEYEIQKLKKSEQCWTNSSPRLQRHALVVRNGGPAEIATWVGSTGPSHGHNQSGPPMPASAPCACPGWSPCSHRPLWCSCRTLASGGTTRQSSPWPPLMNGEPVRQSFVGGGSPEGRCDVEAAEEQWRGGASRWQCGSGEWRWLTVVPAAQKGGEGAETRWNRHEMASGIGLTEERIR
jgi:hypothetical protein